MHRYVVLLLKFILDCFLYMPLCRSLVNKDFQNNVNIDNNRERRSEITG